jgi:uncharacterized protein YhbP (UPF0306 family)
LIPKEFADFISRHHVLSLNVCFENKSWSASCFYAFLKTGAFAIASDKNSRHMQYAAKNPLISGTIHLETKEIGKIQGLQFEGEIKKASMKAKKAYLLSFPLSAALMPTLWEIEINYAKLTNNELGFGKKLVWQKD